MRLLKLSCLAILLIAITSCNKTNEKMMELIPENSTFIASFSPSKILDHTGITVDDNGKLQLPGALKELMEFNKKDLDEGIATLKSAEIDPSANVYVYSSITDVNDASAVMLAISKDPEKTKAAIEKEIKESFKTVGDFAIIAKNDMCIAIKDDIIAIFGGNKIENAEEFAKEVFTKKEKSVLDNDNIKNTLNADADVNYYINLQSYMKLMAGISPQVSLLSGFVAGMDGSGISIDLSDNEIKINSELFADENSDIMKLIKDIQGETSTDFLKYMPAKAKLIFATGIKGEKLAEFEQVKNTLQMISGNPSFGNVNCVELVKSINGPVAFGLDADLKSPMTTLAGTFVITTSKAQEWKKLFDALLRINDGMPMQFAVEAKSDVVIVKFGMNNSFALDASANEDAKKVFDGSFYGFWVGLNVDGMTMYVDTQVKDLNKGTAKFYINGKDGNRMIFGDYPLFFKALDSYMKPKSAASDSFEPEPDYYGDDMEVEEIPVKELE